MNKNQVQVFVFLSLAILVRKGKWFSYCVRHLAQRGSECQLGATRTSREKHSVESAK